MPRHSDTPALSASPSVFTPDDMPESRSCLAWVLRLIIENPAEPASGVPFARAWIDCLLSGQAVFALSQNIPDWQCELQPEQPVNKNQAPRTLPEIKMDMLATSLARFGESWATRPLRSAHSGSLAFTQVQRPAAVPSDRFVGSIAVSAALGDADPQTRLAANAEQFKQWAARHALPGHWIVLWGDPAQLAWDPTYGANQTPKQARFWKPAAQRDRFAAHILSGLEQAQLTWALDAERAKNASVGFLRESMPPKAGSRPSRL